MNDKQFMLAEQAFHRGDLDLAGQICARILGETPRNAPATLLSGLIEVRKGQTSKAVDTLNAALNLSPNDYVALSWLQIALRKELRFRDAIRVGEQARSLWPDDPEVLVSLSHSYLGVQEIEAAASCLAKAAELQPRNAAIHRRLGIAYELLGRDSDAVTEFQTAIQISPTDEDIYVRLGRLLISHGNFTQVLELCKKALKVAPKSAQIHLLSAQALKNLRDDEPAYEHLQTAVALDPNIVISAAMWLQEDGKFDKAAALFERSIDQRPVQGVAYYGLVKGRRVTEADRELLTRMESLLEAPGLPLAEQAALQYGLGKASNDLGDYCSAMQHFDSGNRLNYQTYIAGKGFDPELLNRNREIIVGMFTPEFIDLHRSVGSDSNVPIFIIGMIRSGTTLVEQILASHHEVGGAGEQRFWVNEIPRAVNLDSRTMEDAKFIELRDRYMRVLRSFQPDTPRITDKMPMNFYCAGLLHLAYPNSPIIHVRRHPVDTALSIWMTDLAKPPEFAHDKRNIVAEYRDYLAIMRHWKTIIPESRLMDVRYEDLIADQEDWTRRMLEFCGLEWDPRCLDFFSNDRPISTPSAWQVRQPIYNSSVQKWRNFEPWLGEFAELLHECPDYQ